MGPWTGTNFFPSRHRHCEGCSQRTIETNDGPVTEYVHRGVVCHLIGFDLPAPIDVELLRPGEGEAPAAMRLLRRVFAAHPRLFDAVVADGLYLEAPFVNFCLDHNKHVVTTLKGDRRALLQDAQGLFSNMDSGLWNDPHRTVRFWDADGFTSTAILNFILTLFIAFLLLQTFYLRNLKPPLRHRFTLIAITRQLYTALPATPIRGLPAEGTGQEGP